MKKLLYISAIAALILTGSAQAATVAGSVKGQVKSVEVVAPSVGTGDVRADGALDVAVDAKATGVVKVPTSGEMKGGVNVSGKTEVNVGGDTETEDDTNAAVSDDSQKEDDSKEVGESKTSISLDASEVRGWDAAKKAEILGASLTRTEVRSHTDLSTFAATTVLNDENIDSVEVEDAQIEVVYKFPAKFLGIFKTTIRADVVVAATGEDRVKVKFPWLAFLYSMHSDVKADALIEALDTQLAGQAAVESKTDIAAKADMLDLVSATLRVKHDVAMNSIRNVK